MCLGVLEFSLHHNDEEDAAFVPAAEPADPPIINMIAQGHRLAKSTELGLNVHVQTHAWLRRAGTVNARQGLTEAAHRGGFVNIHFENGATLSYQQLIRGLPAQAEELQLATPLCDLLER
jgi:hypothetical protein